MSIILCFGVDIIVTHTNDAYYISKQNNEMYFTYMIFHYIQGFFYNEKILNFISYKLMENRMPIVKRYLITAVKWLTYILNNFFYYS